MKPYAPVLFCLGVLACSHDQRSESAYDSESAWQSPTYSTRMLASEPDEALTPASGVGEARPTREPQTSSDPASEAAGNNAGINQGDTEADMAVTLRVRESLLQDPTLSFIAKSVTIITRDGRVTLRGLVNSPVERTAVERIARQVGPVRQVDSQLGVVTE
ncbi:MAG TPA: BON domain-containing protein [Polyangiaceae bacterium]|nr:BON domain-containing protein [Polyangiaceae bacterium]